MINQHLFGIVQTIRDARDLILTRGPGLLRNGADILARIQEGFRRAADYIELVGPAIQFTPGEGDPLDSGVDSPEAQKYIAELKAIGEECEAAASRMAQLGANATLESRNVMELRSMSLLNPALRAILLSLIAELVKKVLLKVGQDKASVTVDKAMNDAIGEAQPQAQPQQPQQPVATPENVTPQATPVPRKAKA